MAVLSVLEKVQECDPKPMEFWVHVDLADGTLERELNRKFPNVGVLTSPVRLGPGGGRHRCLTACKSSYAVSFDDDSYPTDSDFFFQVERLFLEHQRAAIFGARIWQRHETEKTRSNSLDLVPNYMGCGHAIRLAAYRQIRGYLARPCAFGMEESDLSLQLFAAGWQIYESGSLRVFHDTDLSHRESPEIASGTITNVGLCAFLHYPFIGWWRGLTQLANIVLWHILRGKIRGVGSGVLRIPIECYRNRGYRRPIAWKRLRPFLDFRRAYVTQAP